MSVRNVSNFYNYNQVCNRKSQDNNSAPISFKASGYGNDGDTASFYIQKYQADQQKKEHENQQKEKWKQFGWNVFTGVSTGAILILATILGISCTKAGREMTQTLTHHYGLSDAASDGASKFKTPETVGKNITADECKKMLQEVNLDAGQQKYVFENICLANKDISKDHYLPGVKLNTCGNRGAILYGRGGIGKSYAMEQIAKACGASYTSIKGNDFMNMYQGMSEGNLKGILLEAKAQAEKTPDKPVIIFLDEGESILGSGRTSGGNNTNAMLRSILLGAMETEGIDALPQNVKFIVTTNFVDDIDEPYRRDGRLGIPMELLCPSAEKQRDIMLAQFKKILSTETYNNNEDAINNYVNNRLKYMQEHQKDSTIQQNKEKIENLKTKIDILSGTYAERINAYYDAIASNANEKDIQAALDNLEITKKEIERKKSAISFFNNGIQEVNNTDQRYFNFTPAEIKGLVNLMSQTLLVKNGPGFDETVMIELEKNKIKELRNKLRNMKIEHDTKPQQM